MVQVGVARTGGTYYLNHVGYKGILSLRRGWDFSAYYLNHVGYKEMNEKRIVARRIDVLSEPCGI